MSGKRLFWISIIILELVLVYLVWRPKQDHFLRPSRRSALGPVVPRSTESKPSVARPTESSPSIVARPTESKPSVVARPAVGKPSPVITAPRQSLKVARSHGQGRKMQLLVNAGLKAPEPIPAKPLVPQSPASPLDSFWCQISKAESNCDCKSKGDEQASNLVMR